MPYNIKGEASVQTGLGLPQHTTVSRLAYTPPAEGYAVYDTDLDQVFFWDGATWGPAQGVSADAEQLLTVGTDGLHLLDPDTMVSADANNDLVKGTDGKLYVDGTNVALQHSRKSQCYNDGIPVSSCGLTAGPTTAVGDFTKIRTDWYANNPVIFPNFKAVPVTLENYGDVDCAQMTISEQNNPVNPIADEVIGVSSIVGLAPNNYGVEFANMFSPGATYKYRFELNNATAQLTSGANQTILLTAIQNDVTNVVWTFSNPAAVIQVGNDAQVQAGQTFEWFEVEFEYVATGPLNLIVGVNGNVDAWTWDLTNYGVGGVGTGTSGTEYFVSFYSDGVSEFYYSVDNTDITNIVNGPMPLPATWTPCNSTFDTLPGVDGVYNLQIVGGAAIWVIDTNP